MTKDNYEMAPPKESRPLVDMTMHGMRVNIPNVAQYILENNDFNFKTVWHKSGETVYAWNGKIYLPNGKEIIKTEVERLTHIYCKASDATEVFEKIKRKTATDKSEFNVDERYINLNNGIYDLEEKKLIPHNPKFLFKHFIPVNFNKESDCPNFKKFLEEALYPDDIPVMQEFYGFCLYRNYFIKKGLICHGQPDTGKTLNQKVLIKFIGEENKAGLSLQKISSNNNFAKIALKDKHLNAFDDLSSEDLSDGGGFKLATGGGYISAEEKFGDTCEFMSYAKQFFCCNKIPPVKDNNDPAYFNRWIVIQFDNVPEKIDTKLYEKLTTEEELSGILNWALDGLYRLLKNNQFSYNKNAEQIKIMMERSGNPLASFVQDVLIKKEDGEISKEDMYQVYCDYLKDKDVVRLSKEQLGRRLPQTINYIQSKRDAKERFWSGVAIRSEFMKKLEEIKNSSHNQADINQFDKKDTIFNNQYKDIVYPIRFSEKSLKCHKEDINKIMEDLE